MNKKNIQLVPCCLLTAVILFFAIIIGFIHPAYEDYKTINDSQIVIKNQEQNEKNKFEELDKKRKAAQIEMESIKQVFPTQVNSDAENLSSFGNMFEDIIKIAQTNGLMIRSIEYDIRPVEDPLYLNYSEEYNACELKFFFVGTYFQLRTFLREITNNFQYLLSISKLNVTAFNANPDYLLINMSLTIYSKKPTNTK